MGHPFFFYSLGPLVNKVKEFQVETIVESLCANMISDKEQLRDISSIGLKTVIAELPRAPGGLSGNICKRITGRLTTTIERVLLVVFSFIYLYRNNMSLQFILNIDNEKKVKDCAKSHVCMYKAFVHFLELLDHALHT